MSINLGLELQALCSLFPDWKRIGQRFPELTTIEQLIFREQARVQGLCYPFLIEILADKNQLLTHVTEEGSSQLFSMLSRYSGSSGQ
ncbi:MAG: hypothetical protein CM15mP74_27430 [Halieaceae bacterium]|nr:MAG: hypothetical protein CM15mP74_27430 [Halieaceae bacterium]